MKVLHIIPSVSPLRGGPSQAVIEMVRALRSEGIDASIVTTEDNGIYRNKEIPINEWIQYRDIPILVHSCMNSRFRSVREYLVSFSLAYWLIKNINSYDVIHIHALFSFPSTISMLIARISGIPYIIRTIGQLNSWSLKQSAIRKRIMMILVERANLDHAKAIHVTSNYERKDLEGISLGEKCFILGLGVYLPSLGTNEDKDLSTEKSRLLFLSRIHPKKQIELLFSALAMLKYIIKEDRWELAVAGAGDESYIELLKGKSKELGIEKNIAWHGHVAGEAKQKLISSSDWFVLPSASENFGISVVEAMASALPVVISNNTGISDKVIDYMAGYICNDDPLNLAHVLLRAINTPDYKKMSKSARKLVEDNYSWKSIGKTLAQFYITIQ